MGDMKRLLLGIAAAVVLAGVIIGAVVGIGSASTTSQAQKDCDARKVAIQRLTGEVWTKEFTAAQNTYCLHDPHRSPASFWQN